MARPFAELVERAQQGDLDAFARLIEHFQQVALGLAFHWLGDAEQARDVAQEAFLEAYLKLAQLREAQAFPAWFRQIVRKYCDRATRRGGRETALPQEQFEALADGREPLSDLFADDAARGVRLSVEALPQREREVVALAYFAELSGPQVAEFLELPLSTVKKRLRDARTRLRQQRDMLMNRTIDAMRPPLPDARFTDEIRFFLALRTGALGEVRTMLGRQPALANARQVWDRDVTTQGILPTANKATALITAIELDNLAMLKLLLEAGADVDGPCGCETSETPVWTATLFNRPAHLRLLLAHGADPDSRSASGNHPLHLAAMRGHAAVARMLLEAGADPLARDTGAACPFDFAPADDARGARTPAQWARLNGHDEIADLMAAFAPEATNDAAEPLSSEDAALSLPAALMPTGIKLLDLFALVPQGGFMRIPLVHGVGAAVLLGELSARALKHPHATVVWTGFCPPPFRRSDWESALAELGLADRVRLDLAEPDQPEAARRAAFQAGIEKACTARDLGRHVFLLLLQADGFAADVEAALPRLQANGSGGSITTALLAPQADGDDTATGLAPPFRSRIALSEKHARAQLWPAIDPLRCASSLLRPEIVGERHHRMARSALAALRAYAAIDADLSDLDMTADRSAEQQRAVRLMRYLRQPFLVAEPFTGGQGEIVTIPALLDAVEQILAE